MRIARDRPLTLITPNRLLSPNQARNIAWRATVTKYVVFVDNDVFAEPGWLELLERCAEDNDAWTVGPLFMRGGRVHGAGGTNRLVRQADGTLVHVGRAHHDRALLANIQPPLTTTATEMNEFHCALVRADLLHTIGPLDEGLLSLHEYFDLCLTITQAGGTVWFEPRAVVAYDSPKRLTAADKPWWFLRWSDAWNNASIRRFAEKWGVEPNDGSLKDLARFGRYHRRICVPWVRPAGHVGQSARRASGVPRVGPRL